MSTARDPIAVEAPDPGDLRLSRQNRFEIDLDAIAHNAATVRGLVGPKTRIFAARRMPAYAPLLVRPPLSRSATDRSTSIAKRVWAAPTPPTR